VLPFWLRTIPARPLSPMGILRREASLLMYLSRSEMSWRETQITGCVAFILTVLALAASVTNHAVRLPEVIVEVSRPHAPNGSTPKSPLVTSPQISSRAERPGGAVSAPFYEISHRDPGAIWDGGPAYDFSRTSQASIYIYMPDVD